MVTPTSSGNGAAGALAVTAMLAVEAVPATDGAGATPERGGSGLPLPPSTAAATSE
jgi:hypothetical protein